MFYRLTMLLPTSIVCSPDWICGSALLTLAICSTGGGWFHPIHMHLVDFYILKVRACGVTGVDQVNMIDQSLTSSSQGG
jgi:hypothetical protein